MRARLADVQGMTLIELLSALVVFSLVMGAVGSLLFTSLTAYSKGGVTTQTQASGRIALGRVARELRQARRLITDVSEPVGGGAFTFNTACGPTPQISFVLPHTATYALSDGTQAYATDEDASGDNPYDGWDVSYYLAAAQTGATALEPNAVGPYLIRAAYDLVAHQGSYSTVAGPVTALTLTAGGVCPAADARDIAVTVTSAMTAANQPTGAVDVVTTDVTLRNQ